MKKRIVRVLVLLMVLVLPVIIYAVSLAPYTDSVTRANNYINKFSDRKKFLIFNKNYVYEKDGFGDSSEFKTGGMVSKSEYDLTVYENQSYLATGKEYWTLTSNGSNKYYIESFIQSKAQSSNSGTRVTQFIKPGTIIKGRGTFANPWTFEEGYEVEIKPNNSSFGSVSPNETKYVKAGSSLEYVLTPIDGYFYNGKKDDCNLIKVGGDIHENKYELSNINRDIYCTAVFELRTYKFSLNIKDDAKDYKGVKKTYSTDPGYNPIYYKHKKDWYSDANTTNPITKINVPVVTGWTFEGYYYGSTKIIDSNGDIINKNLPISDFVITNQAATAQLSKNTFTISYNLNGGVSGSKKPTSSLYDEVIEIDNPTRAGYSFAGWSFNGNSNTAKYGETSSNINSIFAANSTKTKARYFANLNPTNNASVTLTANWESCPAGTYNDGTSTTCTQCPSGTYTTTQGNTSCTQCDEGFYCPGGTEKIGCPSGSFRNSKGGKTANDCTKCVIGSYTNTAGKPSCTPCQANGATGANGTTSAVGATSCNASCNNAHVSVWETAVWNTNNTLTNNCKIKTCATGYTLGSNTCTVNTYTISYAGMDGATHGTSHPTTATYDISFTVNNPSKPGYTFTGWNITGMDSVTHTYGSNTTTATSISKSKETSYKNLRSTSGTVTFTATWSINQYTLTVKPNGGTWNSATTDQSFKQNYLTTKTIADPTATPTYKVTYNANSQGAAIGSGPTNVNRPFTDWTKSGSGEWNKSTKTYKYGPGDGTLTATYSGTSAAFTLPTCSKTGYTCQWAKGSTSGTKIDCNTNTTITGDTTFYMVCTIKSSSLVVNPNGGTWNSSTSSQTFNQNYNTTKTIADPSATPKYTISYNMNGTGITAPTSPKSVNRPFTGFTHTGSGSWNSSTKVFTFGDSNGTLTAGYNTTSSNFTLPGLTLTGNTCKWAQGSASGTQYAGGTARTVTANTTFYAVCTINQYTLTINPNGGTWGGKTTNSTVTQNYNTTYTVANPTAGPTYTITYNANSQGATYTASPTSVQRPFTSWTKSGSGTWNASTKVYTYGAGAGTLTASYNSTSNSFTLPAITKSGSTCKWAEGSASGTQYAGGTSRTITGNTTYYAVCTTANTCPCGGTLTDDPNKGFVCVRDGETDSTTVPCNPHECNCHSERNTGGVCYDMDGDGVEEVCPVWIQVCETCYDECEAPIMYCPSGWSNYSGNAMYNLKCYVPANQVKISLNANGGSVSPSSITASTNNSIGTLPTPTKSGGSFIGWFTSSSGGTQYTSSTVPTACLTLYAHWNNCSCPNGGSLVGDNCVISERTTVGPKLVFVRCSGGSWYPTDSLCPSGYSESVSCSINEYNSATCTNGGTDHSTCTATCTKTTTYSCVYN